MFSNFNITKFNNFLYFYYKLAVQYNRLHYIQIKLQINLNQMDKPNIIFNKVDLPEESAQLFYQVNLNRKQVKIYNQAGKLKILKPINLPPNCLALQWHTAQMYIIYQLQRQIHIYNVLDSQAPVYVCRWEGGVITYVHYDFKANLIFIVDSFNKVYYIEPRKEATCKEFFKAQAKVGSLGVCSKGKITLYYPLKKQVDVLIVKWQTMETTLEKTEQNVKGIYVNQFWNVLIYGPQANSKEGTGFVDINNREFCHSFKPDGQFVISSKPKALLFIDIKYNMMNIIEGDVQTLYNFQQNLPQLKQNKFAFVTKQDVQFKVSLLIQEYKLGEFIPHAYQIIRVHGKQMDVELSANIRNIFKPNGKLNIHFERRAKQWMQNQYKIKKGQKKNRIQNYQSSQLQQQNERQRMEPAKNSQNFQQLPCQFFIYLLRQKTEWVHQISAMIKGSFDKFFLEVECYTFVEYCEQGLMVNIKRQLQELLKHHHDRRWKHHHDRRWNVLLECSQKQILTQCKNTYYFLQKLTKLMKQQLQNDKRHTSEKYQRACNIMEMARSFILIANIIFNNNIQGQFANMKNNFAAQKQKLEKRSNQEVAWNRNGFRPLLCHQYFQNIEYLAQPNLDLHNFFDYLTSISENYYQVAYFYFYLIRSQIPFSHPGVTQFYQDLVNLQPLPEQQQIRKTANKVAGLMMATPAINCIPFVQYLCQMMIICKHPGWSAFLIEFEFYQSLLIQKYKNKNIDIYGQKQINFALFCLSYADQTKNAYALLKRIFKKQLKNTNSFQKFIDYSLVNTRLDDLLFEVKYEDEEEKIIIKNYLLSKLKGKSSEYEQILQDFVKNQ